MSDDYLIGKTLDEYRLEELLGRGGMARVYRAFDTRLKRWVAIKVIATPFRSDSDYIMRFEREAQAIARLEHPNVVTVYRYGEVDDMLYIAMQYVEGVSLDTLLRQYRDESDYMPSADVLKMTRNICQALDYIHEKGVIHRDIKPANIILNKNGQAVVADFGLALLESAGTQGEIFGTPHYIAPEQAISSAGAIHHSDLYAVGVILYETFTGTVPFDAESAMGIAMKHMSELPEPPRNIRPEITASVEAVILKTLEKEPEDRYANGAELVAALEKSLRTRQITAVLPVTPHVSVTDRVSEDLSERPMPPLPAGVATMEQQPPLRPSSLRKTAPMQGYGGEEVTTPPAPTTTAPTPAAAPPQKNKNSMLYLGLGAVVLLLVCGAIIGSWFIFGGDERSTANDQPSAAEEGLAETATSTPGVTEPTAEPQTEEAVAEAEPSATPVPPSATPVPSTATATSPPEQSPTDTPIPPLSVETEAPTPPPTETPTLSPTEEPTPSDTPEPQPIADTNANFSGTQGAGSWNYQWSRGRESFNWADMQFDGACWRISEQEGQTEPSVRICQSSAHPGITGDIAWRWSSSVDRDVWVQLFAYKIDTGGGDGVDIVVYRNTEELQRWRLDGTDGNGFSEGLSVPVTSEDYIFVVMKIAGDPSYDETGFQVQIY